MSKGNAQQDSGAARGSKGKGKKAKERKSGFLSSIWNMFRVALLAGIIAVIWSFVNTAPYTETVLTTSGPIRGQELTFESTDYKAFLGIPYAAPPVGALKFSDPQPPEKWTEVRDTTSYGNICHQPRRAGNIFKMDPISIIKVLASNTPNILRQIMRVKGSSEDCLTLNVFTPSLKQDVLKPVLVWIHGGGFFAGDGSDTVYGPQYLIQRDIVIVTLNYRIGPLGFLSTNTSDASGNWGLKDQVAALKWVQNNIAQFGGDPKQVTIYGESAGGASVHFHLFSPLSRGLFHRAIPVSGTAVNAWSITHNQDRFSRNLARLMGASESVIEDPTQRIAFLRSVDAKAMTSHMFEAVDKEDTVNPFFNPLPFTPVIEPAGTKGAFLTEDPQKLLTEGKFTKVPMMIGVNDLEGGLMYMGLGKNTTPEAVRAVEENVCLVLPQPLRDGVIKKGDCSNIAKVIRDVYFGGKPFDSCMLKFLHFFGDVIMVEEVHFASLVHAKYATKENPFYRYYFTFDGEWNMLKKLFQVAVPGAIHGDELTYVFKPRLVTLPTLPPTSREVITKDRMISFITNFVKYGNPTPTIDDLVPVNWEPVTENEPNTLIINDDLKLEKQVLKTRMDMWDQMYKKYTGKSLYE